MRQQCFPQSAAIMHKAYVDCLLCSPAHHTSSPTDTESFCKSVLKPEKRALHGQCVRSFLQLSHGSQISQSWSLMLPRWELELSQPSKCPEKWGVSSKMCIWHICTLLSCGSFITVTVRRGKRKAWSHFNLLWHFIFYRGLGLETAELLE